jgi:GT2 family glycosyltransferase
MTKETKKAAFIIVNWNGKKLLKNCLDAVFNQTYSNFDVYFVDNGSEDGSSDYVSENYSDVNVIQLDKNTGFAKGNNIGIKKALKDKEVDYIVAINNDTKAEADFLEKLVASVSEEEKIGAVAPKIKFFYEPELIDSVGVLIHFDGGGLSRGNREKDLGQFDKREEIFGACGGAVLYTREMLEDIGNNNEFFDEIFFAYYEDLDLAWRAKLRGWKTVSCPQAIIHHVHSATSFEPIKIVLKGWLQVIYYLPVMIKKRFIIQKNRIARNKEIKEWFRKYSAKMEDMIYR